MLTLAERLQAVEDKFEDAYVRIYDLVIHTDGEKVERAKVVRASLGCDKMEMNIDQYKLTEEKELLISCTVTAFFNAARS